MKTRSVAIFHIPVHNASALNNRLPLAILKLIFTLVPDSADLGLEHGLEEGLSLSAKE